MRRLARDAAGRAAPLLAAAAFLVLLTCYRWERPWYQALMTAGGAPPVYLRDDAAGRWDLPFFDTRFVLAQLACWRRGIDVYSVNPCDPLGRLQDYSPLWLRLGFIPADPDDAVRFGLALDLMFLVSLFLLPRARPRLTDQIALSLAMVSSATLFAMERGNTDLLVFAMCVIAARLLARAPPLRALGYGVILAAAALKFYPLAALAVALRERVRTLRAVAAVTLGAVAAFTWAYGAETKRALANTASGYFGVVWGAATLPFGGARIAMAAWPALTSDHPMLRAALAGAIPRVVLVLLLALAATLALRLASQRAFADAFVALPDDIGVSLVVGTALTAGCFLAHQNIGYRAIVLLLEMPGLMTLVAGAPPGRLRILLRGNVAAVLFLLWDAPWLLPTTSAAGWLLRLAVWWAHVTVGLAVLARFAAESAACRWVRHPATSTTPTPPQPRCRAAAPAGRSAT